MIEFRGNISKNTLKHLVKKHRFFGLTLSIIATSVVLPLPICIGLYSKSFFLLNIVCGVLLIFWLLPLRPFTKGELDKMSPKKITLEDEYIVVITGYGSESRLIDEAKELRDYGAFYEIVFPVGKVSCNFICQKNLLVSGTLEKFEAKFKGKIVRK